MAEFSEPQINRPVDGSLLAQYNGRGSRREGTVLADLSNNGNTGTTSAILWKNTPLGHNVLTFDGGSNRKVDLGTDFIGTGAVTISAWIFPETFGDGGFGRIIANDQLTLIVVDDGTAIGENDNSVAFTSNGGTQFASSALNSIILGRWQHVSVTRTSAGAADFYVNGVLSGTAGQDSGTPVGASMNTFIGINTTNTREFDGKIDDVRVYNKIFTANEAMKAYQETKHYYGL